MILESYILKFIKDTCKVKKEQPCASCTNGWQGPKMDRIPPLSFPDKETFRYTGVYESPATSPDRKTSPVGDFMLERKLRNTLMKKS